MFTVEDGDPAFFDDLNILLPQCLAPAEAQVEKISCGNDLRVLQNRIFELHAGCFWMDAGCLIAPNGKKVLIVGRSGAGKSSTTMALALGHGWKVIAEDILLIDVKMDRLIAFGAPFSLKAGTYELLRDSIGLVPDPILNDEWSPLGTMVVPSEQDSHFDLAIALGAKTDVPQQMHVSSLSTEEYLRKCLRLSNVLRLEGASEKLLQYVSSANRLAVKGGSLRERLELILSLVGSEV